ncbi:MAG: hypothetical protein PVG99_13890 [Desulfobacteraceae bacterium]|jgi:hypothetical protein
MGDELKIEIWGDRLELLIDVISRERSEEILQICRRYEFHLEEIWYDDRIVIADKPWQERAAIFQGRGILFSDRNEITEFLNDDLHRPCLKGIYLNERPVPYDGAGIVCRYHDRAALPELGKNLVFVTHGVVNRVTWQYRTQLAGRFDESEMVFYFADCAEYGIILSEIAYGGRRMQETQQASSTEYYLDVTFADAVKR